MGKRLPLGVPLAPAAEFRQQERHNVDRPDGVGLPAECRAKRWWQLLGTQHLTLHEHIRSRGTAAAFEQCFFVQWDLFWA